MPGQQLDNRTALPVWAGTLLASGASADPAAARSRQAAPLRPPGGCVGQQIVGLGEAVEFAPAAAVYFWAPGSLARRRQRGCSFPVVLVVSGSDTYRCGAPGLSSRVSVVRLCLLFGHAPGSHNLTHCLCHASGHTEGPCSRESSRPTRPVCQEFWSQRSGRPHGRQRVFACVPVVAALDQRQGGSCLRYGAARPALPAGACSVVIGWPAVVHLIAQV